MTLRRPPEMTGNPQETTTARLICCWNWGVDNHMNHSGGKEKNEQITNMIVVMTVYSNRMGLQRLLGWLVIILLLNSRNSFWPSLLEIIWWVPLSLDNGWSIKIANQKNKMHNMTATPQFKHVPLARPHLWHVSWSKHWVTSQSFFLAFRPMSTNSSVPFLLSIFECKSAFIRPYRNSFRLTFSPVPWCQWMSDAWQYPHSMVQGHFQKPPHTV